MLTQDQIEQLILKMSLQEKAAEMTQIWMEDPDKKLMGTTRGYHKSNILRDNAGSLLGFDGAEKVISVQKEHLKASAHNIPLLFMTDVIHGYKTIFPSVLGLGCSWNTQLIKEIAHISALEASVSGVHVTFSPMADLVRDARWGRVIESTGEDPLLNSLYAAAFTEGYQGDSLKEYGTLAACVKHFIGYGAAEGGRDYNSTQIGDYELYNQYLPSFEAAIKAGCRLLMPGFNTVNGIPCTCNKALLKNILHDYLRFNGIIISDCTAINELIKHQVCETPKEAAELSFSAGLNIEMVSSCLFDSIPDSVNQHTISEEILNESVRKILNLKNELGLFDNPNRFANAEKEKQYHLCPAHRKAARKAVQQSCVLLKNNGQVLPLNPDKKVALIGPFADSQKFIDIWGCVNGEEKDVISLKKAFPWPLAGSTSGCSLWNLRYSDVSTCQIENEEYDAAEMQQAISLATNSDIIILALGEHPEMSSEAGSRADITLPENQMQLLRKIKTLGKPIVTLLFAGRPLAITEVSELSDALLYCWFPGTEGGNGICDLLTGKASPEARLCITIPRCTGQVPVYYNHLPTGRPCPSETYKPFTSGYIDLLTSALYPFGYGLSYTTFEYSKPALIPHNSSFGIISVTVTNTGNLPGTETVQYYIRDMAGTYSRPVKMLKGFKKITLQPGESQEVSFTITKKDLEYYIPDTGWTVEPGTFRIYIGSDSSVQDYLTITINA